MKRFDVFVLKHDEPICGGLRKTYLGAGCEGKGLLGFFH